ncbi:MAG: DUF1570 domain-containing protein [Thermoguttaceae bacterium]
MLRTVALITVWASLCSPGVGAVRATGSSAEDSDSRYEQVEMFDHSRYAGLIESEDGDWLTLIRIQSPRGQRMHLVIQPLDRRQILSVSRLDAGKRAALAQRIEEFRNRATIEAASMEAIRLEPREAEGCNYRHYRSNWFTLDSTADEQNTRRVIVRAEQIFAAYRQIVPPRSESSQPPRLVVLGSMDQYQSLLTKLGLKMKIENPACFLEDQNVVVVGSDLARLAAVTSQITAQNAQLRKDLHDLDGRLAERLRVVADSLRKSGLSNGEIARELTREREKFKKQLEKKRDELRQSDQQIDRLFKKSASQTLVRLYHEAFHAYLRNNVYPRQKYDVPPWLNEGLAVIFEGGQLEGNTLRVDAPNPVAVRKLKADLAGPEPLELEKLLAAGEGQFLLTTSTRSGAVDRYYVYAWGLTFYLTFEKHLLGSPALEKYLQSGSARLAPAQRFQQLIGMPLEQFEKDWRAYIRAL